VDYKGNYGVKGSRSGCTGVTSLLKGDTGGLRGALGAVDVYYSLSPPKTVCVW